MSRQLLEAIDRQIQEVIQSKSVQIRPLAKPIPQGLQSQDPISLKLSMKDLGHTAAETRVKGAQVPPRPTASVALMSQPRAIKEHLGQHLTFLSTHPEWKEAQSDRAEHQPTHAELQILQVFPAYKARNGLCATSTKGEPTLTLQHRLPLKLNSISPTVVSMRLFR